MPQPSDVLKQILRTWLHERHQALLEQVMMTWEEGLGRLQPDDAVAQQLLAAMPEPPPPPAAPARVDVDGEVGTALDLLDNAVSQAEVLHKLLDGLRPFADRSALFILKQGLATLYASRGFDGDSARPGISVVPPSELEALISGQLSVIQQVGEGYLALVKPLSGLTAGDLRILPIRLKRKAVALVLTDSGVRRTLENPHHVRTLVRCAEAALAFLAGPKEDDKPGTGPLRSTGPIPLVVPVAMPTMVAPHATPPASAPAAPPLLPPPTPLPPLTSSSAHAASTLKVPVQSSAPPEYRPPAPAAPAPLPPSSMPTQRLPEPGPEGPVLDPKIRTTAERLARVLVGDIELYFPQKVAQGRQQGNLYALLRDELERSRATFIDRFGEPVEKQHRIFIQTVYGQLCEGIHSKLGPAPWG